MFSKCRCKKRIYRDVVMSEVLFMLSGKTSWVFSMIIALLLTMAGVANAEIVGRTSDDYIHRYIADNGQEIYFVSTSEEEYVEIQDVNFDGHPDLAIVTALGASNAYYEFYLWNGTSYEYAERQTDDIINYALVDDRYLVSKSNDGSAGALFHAQICVWDGNMLKTIRTMVSEEESITDFNEDSIVTTVYWNRIHVSVMEADPALGEAIVIWEKSYDSIPDEAFFNEMESRLWDGIR